MQAACNALESIFQAAAGGNVATQDAMDRLVAEKVVGRLIDACSEHSPMHLQASVMAALATLVQAQPCGMAQAAHEHGAGFLRPGRPRPPATSCLCVKNGPAQRTRSLTAGCSITRVCPRPPDLYDFCKGMLVRFAWRAQDGGTDTQSIISNAELIIDDLEARLQTLHTAFAREQKRLTVCDSRQR